MNSQIAQTTNTASTPSEFPQALLDAIHEAQLAEGAYQRADAALEAAILAVSNADSAYRLTPECTDEETEAWTTFQHAADDLTAAAIARTDARMHRDQTRALLEDAMRQQQSSKR